MSTDKPSAVAIEAAHHIANLEGLATENERGIASEIDRAFASERKAVRELEEAVKDLEGVEIPYPTAMKLSKTLTKLRIARGENDA